MNLAALVTAHEGDAGVLRGLLPIAGVTLLEHQFRRLAAAGVTRSVLLLDEWPAALAAPLARLRADGIAVEAVIGIGDAADRLAVAPRVLVLADGCLPDRAAIDRLATAPVPSLLTIPDAPDRATYERIDAEARWAGIALLDGRRIAEAAAMIGDWDPVSTLLRRAVQEGAARIDAGREPPIIATSAALRGAVEARLVGGSREAARGWADRFVAAPLVELLLPLLFRRQVGPFWPAAAASLLALGGGCAALGGHRWPALIPLLLSLPLAKMATRLAGVQARAIPAPRWFDRSRLAGLALGALGLGGGLAGTSGQWGWWLVAAAIPALLGAQAVQRRILVWLGGGAEPIWLAGPDAMAWALLPFAMADAWSVGLAALGAYAVGSFGSVLHRCWRKTEPS